MVRDLEITSIVGKIGSVTENYEVTVALLHRCQSHKQKGSEDRCGKLDHKAANERKALINVNKKMDYFS